MQHALYLYIYHYFVHKIILITNITPQVFLFTDI